jgi:two-component system, cell cycle response regulator CtrA
MSLFRKPKSPPRIQVLSKSGLARHYDFDIIVLDLLLPDMEGYEVLRRLRAARLEVPVLIVSGLSRPNAKIKGFEVGADDFITKPFDANELVARIRAIVRRSKGYSEPRLVIGPLCLKLDSREVFVADKALNVTIKEYAILELLMLRKGVVLTKEAFLDHLYGGMDEPERQIINVFIYTLRKKLAKAGAHKLIGTVRGRGYVVRDAAVSLNGKPPSKSRSGSSRPRLRSASSSSGDPGALA